MFGLGSREASDPLYVWLAGTAICRYNSVALCHLAGCVVVVHLKRTWVASVSP